MKIETIKEFVKDSVVFDRGMDCYRNLLVRDYKSENNTLSAHVQGSRKKAYQVLIKLEGLRRFVWVEIKSLPCIMTL